MRQLIQVIFGVSLSFAAWAGPVKVVATTQDLASLVEAVGGDDVSVSYIVRGDLDPHFVDAKPSYMVKLATADLVVAVGMDLEIGWLPSLLTGARNPRIQPGSQGYLDASLTVRRIEVPVGAIDRARGDLHPQGNPHYWLMPENGGRIAAAIADRLIVLDPANAADYRARLAGFEAELATKQAEWGRRMAPLKGTPIVGYHMTFDYFAVAFELPIIGFVEPKPGIPPTPSHTAEVMGAAKSVGAKFVLVEPYHDPRDAGPVASGAGMKVLVLPTSTGAMPGVDTWFDLIDRVVTILTEDT